jgi:uncharacterized protein
MKYYDRDIDKSLQEWRLREQRKPLLIRGARQVGKSASVRELSKTFSSFVEVNFESHRDVCAFFQNAIEPDKIIQFLSAYYGKQIRPGETLLFFDEIQLCPGALLSLRYFFEKLPDLHVIAAGSLLEFSLESIPSFAVGRLEILYIYGFSFQEFLNAKGEKPLLQVLNQANFSNPLPEALHQKLLNELRLFMIIGGMPEVVSEFIQKKELLTVQRILNSLVQTTKTDFGKYREKVPSSRLYDVWLSAAGQVGSKFIYRNIPNESNQKQLKESLDLLLKAGILHAVTHSSGNGIPLGAEADAAKRKILPHDTGIYLSLLGLELRTLITDDLLLINDGALAELFCGLELIKYSAADKEPALWYWHREAPNANAEVDYLLQKGKDVIPVEVKARTRGGMKSLNLFLEEKSSPYGYRVSSENFSEYKNIKVLPLYAVFKMQENR